MQTELLNVSGMSCGSCVGKITHALRAVDGVSRVDVSLAAREVKVEFDEGRTSKDQVASAIEGAGYAVAKTAAAPPKRASGCCCG